MQNRISKTAILVVLIVLGLGFVVPVFNMEGGIYNFPAQESTFHFLISTIPGLTFFIIATICVVLITILVFRQLIKRYRRGEIIRLSEKDKLLNAIIGSVPVILYQGLMKKNYQLTPEGMPMIKINFVSDQQLFSAGISPQDVKNDLNTFYNMIDAEYRQGFIDENIEAATQLRPFRWEGSVDIRGIKRWIRMESIPRLNDNEDIVWTGYIVDNSQQRQAEADLNHRKEFESLLFEISVELINVQRKDFDGLITETLGKIANFCMVDRAYLFLMDEKQNLVSNTHEWCRAGIKPQIENLQNLSPHDYPMWGKYMLNQAVLIIDDTSLMSPSWEKEKELALAQEIKSLVAVPIVSHDKVRGFVGVDAVKSIKRWRDYEIQLLQVFASLIYNVVEKQKSEKALRESEQKYRVITESAFDGIYLLGLQSFIYVNQRFCEILGYTSDELLNNNFDISKIIGEASKKTFEDRKRARLERRDIPRTYELQLLSKSGQLVDVEISTTPLGYRDKIQILGIVRDITERKINEALLREVAIAKQSLQFKQKFLANMSHEIRTPLTGILGMVEILADTKLDSQQKDYVNTLKISTENLKEISNQILDYSKIEAGKIKLRKDIFDKRAILSNAKKLFESICHKEIILETEIDHEIPDLLKGDEKRIMQILYNLLSNAVKFTFKGKIAIKAGLRGWLDNEKVLIEVKVSDTGIGIDPEYLNRIFLPFEQFDNQKHFYIEGTGLGLSICKELTLLMGGQISAESEVGKGSTFTFSFIAEVVSEQWSDNENLNLKSKQAKTNLSILYAEDKAVNQKVVSLMLKSLGHKVVLASNGQEAIEKYQSGKFDLILMDIQMPVLDGVDATRKLKLYFNDLPPIVGLSANAFEGDRNKYLELGMDEYLTKPVKAEDFSELIHKLF